MINKKLILENAIRFGFINELKKSKKNQAMIEYAVKLGFAIDQGGEAIFPWNKTGNPAYETWLLNQLKDKNHAQKGLVDFQEDGDKLEEFIFEFDRLKKQRQITGVDINQLDFSGVKKIVNDNKQNVSRKALERGDVDTSTAPGYELKIFKSMDDAKEVVSISEKTEWCTDELDVATSYLRKGAIYVIYKNQKPYVQLHVETNQYMDVDDNPISQNVWKELRDNIPFISQLVKKKNIVIGMDKSDIEDFFDKIYSFESFNGDFNLANLTEKLISYRMSPELLNNYVKNVLKICIRKFDSIEFKSNC